MRYLLPSILLVFLSFPSLVLGETVEFDELVERDGFYYKKFTDVPFTGRGTRHEHHGRLLTKGTFKNGRYGGLWVYYNDAGDLRRTGVYWNGGKLVSGSNSTKTDS